MPNNYHIFGSNMCRVKAVYFRKVNGHKVKTITQSFTRGIKKEDFLAVLAYSQQTVSISL